MGKIIVEPSKRSYKQVKFDKDIHNGYIEKGRTIKFYYGIESLSRITGRITKIYEKGVECLTDYGLYNATWDRIYRIFVPKTSGVIKESNIKSAKAFSSVSTFDGILNRIINKCKEDYPKIKIKDKRVNLSTRYSRNIKFSIGRQSVEFDIENQDSNKIEISGTALKRKSSVKLNKKGKMSISSLYNKIKILVE